MTDEDVAPKAGLLRECRAAFDWWRGSPANRRGRSSRASGWARAWAWIRCGEAIVFTTRTAPAAMCATVAHYSFT